MAGQQGRSDPKEAALAATRCLNPHPEQVTDPAFLASEFFDARDAVQVKYEMVRKVKADGAPVTAAAAAFGYSRPAYYEAASVTGAPPAFTRRTISYLTCTRSRASKNSLARNPGSRTCSGRGFRQRVAASAASLGSVLPSRLAMPPPDLYECQEDLARHGCRAHAPGHACHQIPQENRGSNVQDG